MTTKHTTKKKAGTKKRTTAETTAPAPETRAPAPDEVVVQLSAYAISKDGPLTPSGLADVRRVAADVIREMPHASPSEQADEVARRWGVDDPAERHDAAWIAQEMRHLLGWMAHNIETLHCGDVATSEVNNLREQLCRMLAIVIDVESLMLSKAVTP